MDRPVFIINLKNYADILGEPALKLCRAAESVSDEVDVMVAPPVPSLALIAPSLKIPVLSQRVDDSPEGKSTGAIIPEALKAWGCAGSMINHAEATVPLSAVAKIVPRMKALGLISCVCVRKPEEVSAAAALGPEHIAVEPPELIGTGISVSTARPGLILDSVLAARTAGYRGKLLCGAGIVTSGDVGQAVELGAQGILVASSVVKALDWEAKVRELASALIT